MIEEKDFEAWMENPTTEAVFGLIEDAINQTVARWNNASWNEETLWRNDAAQHLRTACKARAEALEDIRKITFEEFDDWQQERNQTD